MASAIANSTAIDRLGAGAMATLRTAALSLLQSGAGIGIGLSRRLRGRIKSAASLAC